jgi:hypothetical protein
MEVENKNNTRYNSKYYHTFKDSHRDLVVKCNVCHKEIKFFGLFKHNKTFKHKFNLCSKEEQQEIIQAKVDERLKIQKQNKLL